MTRLGGQEIKDAKQRLSQWQSPTAMLQAIKPLMEMISSVDLFNQPNLGFLREAWVAATFAGMRSVMAVRLVADQWPDFQLQIGDKVEAFELVEADLPERKRGKEYRERAANAGATSYPIEEWQAAAEKAPDAVRQAAAKKAAKNYGSRAGLLIYLNIQEFGIRQSAIEASFTTAVEPAKAHFSPIWVLWKAKAYLAHSDSPLS